MFILTGQETVIAAVAFGNIDYHSISGQLSSPPFSTGIILRSEKMSGTPVTTLYILLGGYLFRTRYSISINGN
jgi:hypothetical protein